MPTEIILDAFGRSKTLPGVYSDFAPFFRLIHVAIDGTKTPFEMDDEPIDWKNTRFSLKRDADLHGVNYEYSNSSVEFNGNDRDFINSVFFTEGEDATILLQYGIHIPELNGQDAYDVVEYEGRLNLATRKTAERRVSCDLERSSLQTQVSARWDANLNLAASKSLDNVSITPPTFRNITLSPQSLDERFTANLLSSKRAESTFPGDTNGHVWIQFDTSQPQIAEIDELAGGRPMGLSESDGPINLDEWLFKLVSSGNRQIKIALTYDLWFTVKKRTISIGPARITGYRLDTFLTIVRANGDQQDFPITTPLSDGLGVRNVNGQLPASGFSESEVSITASGTLDVALDLKAGDKIFLYGLLWFSHNKNELQSTQVAVTTKTQRISIVGRSKNQASIARCLPVYDAMNAALAVITGLPDRFRSEFYGLQSARYPTDGCGSRRVLFNGFAARQFKALDRPLSLSFQDAVTSLSAIDATGLQYGFELDDNGNPLEIVTMKPVREFFRPVELMRFDEVGDYSEESVPSEIYSQVNVGYEKWVDEGSTSLEEVFTTHQVTTPIKHESGTKPIVSKLVASSLAIEKTRREQFTDSPKDGTTFDESVFILQCKSIQSYSGAGSLIAGLVNYIIQLPVPLTWLAVGQRITLSGTASNDGTYTVNYVSDIAQRPWTFYVAEDLSPEVLTSLQIAPAAGVLDLQPETGADFDQVTGLQSPNDTYNLRLSPARMLWNNVPLWAGCLINKDKYNVINHKAVTETGLIQVAFRRLVIFNILITDMYIDWLAAGMTISVSGSTGNDGQYTVIAVSPPDYRPWQFFVKEVIQTETAPLVNISFEKIGNDDLYAAVNKTKIPNNKNVVTTLPAIDTCGRAGRVSEADPLQVDQLIPELLFVPRRIRFKRRLSHAEIQRLRLGHMGLLPTELDTNGDPVDPNYGYISLLDERGIRVAGWLNEVEYSRDNEEAVFELRQTALDLADTTSGLDCSQFAGWTLAQAMAADERTRRRIELCRFIDVDPL
ncbi:hypothetical protein GCM10028805_22440 [Spirosoma harenae]